MASPTAIKLTRHSQLYARLRPIRVKFDGAPVGSIAVGQTVEIAAAPGTHTLECAMTWTGRASTTVHIDENTQHHLVCGFNVGLFGQTLYLRPSDVAEAANRQAPHFTEIAHESTRRWWLAALMQSSLCLIAAGALTAAILWSLHATGNFPSGAEALAEKVGLLVGLVTGASIGLTFLWHYLKNQNRP